MIYDLENNRLIVNWPEPEMPKPEAYTAEGIKDFPDAYKKSVDLWDAYNNRPSLPCHESCKLAWAHRNGEEIPEKYYKTRYEVWEGGWCVAAKEEYDDIISCYHKRVLAYPVTKEAGAAPGSKAYYFENAILAFGVDAAIEYFATAEDKQQEIREHLSGLSPQPAQPAGQGENDDAAILAAKKLGILSGAPLNYFIQGYNASQPASQQPSGEEDSRAVDDEDKYYSYEETGTGKNWDDMTELERVKYESNKMRSALLFRRNHIRHLQKTRAELQKENEQLKVSAARTVQAMEKEIGILKELITDQDKILTKRLDALQQTRLDLQSQLASKPVDHYGEGLIELAKEIERLRGENDQLQAWKKEAIAVMPDYQAIGKAIGVKLGESVHDKILPEINRLQAKAAHLEIGMNVQQDTINRLQSQLSLLQSREGGFGEWATSNYCYMGEGVWSDYGPIEQHKRSSFTTADLFTQFLNETGKQKTK
jgi:hypothetical protein